MAIELEELCYTYVQTLADVAGQHYPANKRQQTGFIDSLLSVENKSMAQTEELGLDRGNGKDAQVALRYIKPATDDEMGDEEASVCEAGTETADTWDLVSLTKITSSPVMSFTKESMRKLCEGTEERKQAVIMSHMDGFFRAINKVAIGLYEANVGAFMDGSTSKTISLLNEDSGGRISADPFGETLIIEEFRDMGFSGKPLVVGAGHLSQYASLQKIGCCNQWGQQINLALANMLYYRDRDVDNIIGNPLTSTTDKNWIIAYAPGAIQLVSRPKNKGEFETIHPHSVETTVIDPITGLEIDMEMYYDRCDKEFKVAFNLNWDLWFLPLTMYKAGDDRYGTNNSLLFKSELS